LIVDARSFDEMTKAVIKDSIWVGFLRIKLGINGSRKTFIVTKKLYCMALYLSYRISLRL
jgi:hypothetical protein